MPIPRYQVFLLPVLQVLADGARHGSPEIRKSIAAKFKITPQERRLKNKIGFVFVNRVAWALANLNMERGPNGHTKAITLVKKEVYRITEYGTAILKTNPSSLTIRDLKRYPSIIPIETDS